MRQDWEGNVPRYHTCGNKTINDLTFSRSGLLLAAASTDKNIYLFQFQDGDYKKLSACKLENGIPVSVNFSEDGKKIVICTN
jgi:WD40 repeat protein